MTAAHRQRACSLGDIDGGNEIGVVLETTGFATEMGLGRAIALLTVPTSAELRNLYRMLLAPHPVLRENIPLEAQPQTVAE